MCAKFNLFAFILAVFLLSGCSRAVNRTLSPPADTKWVNVEVKNPSPYTKPFPLEVRYISHKCLKKRISGFDGSVITEPNYNGRRIPMQQQGSSDIWRAKVAMTGGGSCQWTLSAVTLGIEYIEAAHLGKELVPGTAVGTTVAFDDDASRNGQYLTFKGDMYLAPHYYPYITEWNINKKKKDLSLLGRKSFLKFKVYNLSKVIYSPVLDEGKIVKYIEPLEKKDGSYPKIIYPDGSVAPSNILFPDFEKVDKMQIK